MPLKHITGNGTHLLSYGQAVNALDNIKAIIHRYELENAQPILTLERVELLIERCAELGILNAQHTATNEKLFSMRREITALEAVQAQRVERMNELNSDVANFVTD